MIAGNFYFQVNFRPRIKFVCSLAASWRLLTLRISRVRSRECNFACESTEAKSRCGINF
jgi:hypothetical protein